jgi:hypothetical protein
MGELINSMSLFLRLVSAPDGYVGRRDRSSRRISDNAAVDHGLWRRADISGRNGFAVCTRSYLRLAPNGVPTSAAGQLTSGLECAKAKA